MENKNLEAKMEQFIPGMPEDPASAPSLYYQVLLGRVYTLWTAPNESTARGEITLEQFETLRGEKVTREGWYSASGDYVGAQLPGSLLED